MTPGQKRADRTLPDGNSEFQVTADFRESSCKALTFILQALTT